MGDCGVTCAKYSVFFFILLFAVTGIAILIVGSMIHFAYNHYSTFIGGFLWFDPVIIMIIGGAVFLIASFGCCGAIKESSCMVLTFSILLIVIFLVEIGVGITGYAQHDQMKDILEKGFKNAFDHYEQNQQAWQLLQHELHCCGIVNGPKDWIDRIGTLPMECCATLPIGEDKCTEKDAYEKGCIPVLLSNLQEKSLILASIGVGIGLIQIIGIAYACFLYGAFRKHNAMPAERATLRSLNKSQLVVCSTE